MPKLFFRILIVCCLAAFLSACRSGDVGEDQDPAVPPPPQGTKVQVQQDKQLRLLTPTVDFDDGVMNVTGYARRRPGVRSVISGRIDIEVLDSEGNFLQWIPALLYPNPVPTEGRGESGYVIHYGWVPPAGSVVRVRFVDSKTAVIEDATNSETVGGSYGTHSGNRPSGATGGMGHY